MGEKSEKKIQEIPRGEREKIEYFKYLNKQCLVGDKHARERDTF